MQNIESVINTGGAEKKTEKLMLLIQNNPDTPVSRIVGTTYYVSTNGNDGNTGTSEKSPIKTISKLSQFNLSYGDSVRFERGGVFRTDITLKLYSGVTYGTYGAGDKPIICGSAFDYAVDKTWQSTDFTNVWSVKVSGEAGVVTFDNDRSVGVKKYSIDSLNENGDYFHDVNKEVLYLYSEKNPSFLYKNIEIGSTNNLFSGHNVDDVVIENLVLKYTSKHGMSLGNNKNLTISGCEVGWIGGKLYRENKRFGNGIQIWNECHGVKVSFCRIYQVYDAALTFQGRHESGVTFENVTFSDNLIEYCSMNLEFWGSDQLTRTMDSGENVKIDNVLFERNILRFGGYGWGAIQRPDKGNQAFLLGWNFTYKPGKVNNFVIRDNIFDCANCNFIWSKHIFILNNNTYYQKKVADNDINVEVIRGAGLFATDQASFEKCIIGFDEEPKKIKWLS